MAEEGKTNRPVLDADGVEQARIYSTTGELRKDAEFREAFKEWQDTGEAPKGFMVLEPGVMSTLRRGFEAVNQPLQQGARALDQGSEAVTQRLVNLARGAVGAQPLPSQPLQPGVGMPASSVASSVSTPEKLGATLGTAAGAAASGGLSLPLQAAATGLGAAAGSALSTGLTGEGLQLGRAATEGIVAGLGQGALGLAKWAIGNGMSRQAGEGVAKELGDYLKTRHPELANDPNLVDLAMKSKDFISKVTQAGMKGLRQDFQSVQDDILTSLNTRLPNTLSRSSAAEIRNHAKTWFDLGNDLLDNLGDPEKYAKIKAAMSATKDDMETTLMQQFKSASDPVKQRAILQLSDVVDKQKEALMKYADTADLLGVLKKANAGQQFDERLLQQELLSRLNASGRPLPGEAVQAAVQAAGRGAPLTSGLDTEIIGRHKLPSFLGGFNVGPFGQKYIGSVLGSVPAQNMYGAVAGRDAMRRFLGGD